MIRSSDSKRPGIAVRVVHEEKDVHAQEQDLSCLARAEEAKASRGALHQACISGQYKTVKMLLNGGEDVDQRDEMIRSSDSKGPGIGVRVVCEEKDVQVQKQDLSCMARAEEVKASRSALHKASISGQYETVKMLLDNGEDVDQRDKFSLTPLHLACWYGQESVVRLLLEHGANVNAVDTFQRTPLQKAERHNHQSIVQLLLRNNANPSYQQPLSLKSLARKALLKVDRRSGFNLLHAAIFEGKYSIVFKAHPFLNFVKETNRFETTENIAKLFPGKKTAVDILLGLKERGRGHAQIYEGYLKQVEKYNTLTDLHRCVRGDDDDNDDAEKAVELVLNDGVDVNISASCNPTPLLWASLSCSSMFIKTLIDLGADVNAQRINDKSCSLILATYWNHFMVTHLLLEHGADPNSKDVDGDTPLHASVDYGFYEVSQLLIEAKSNINLRNKEGRTPLYFAVKNKHEQLVKLLLESNADVNMKYQQYPKERLEKLSFKFLFWPDWTYIVVKKHLLGLFEKKWKTGLSEDFGTVVESGWGKPPPSERKHFEKIGKKVNAMFPKIPGNTLVHVASRNDNTKIIDLLVKYGAVVNARDAEGFTPLHMAAIHGNMQVVKKLVDLEADVNLSTVDGKDIVDLAHLNEEAEIEEYLKSKMATSQRTKEKEVKQVATCKSM